MTSTRYTAPAIDRDTALVTLRALLPIGSTVYTLTTDQTATASTIGVIVVDYRADHPSRPRPVGYLVAAVLGYKVDALSRGARVPHTGTRSDFEMVRELARALYPADGVDAYGAIIPGTLYQESI